MRLGRVNMAVCVFDEPVLLGPPRGPEIGSPIRHVENFSPWGCEAGAEARTFRSSPQMYEIITLAGRPAHVLLRRHGEPIWGPRGDARLVHPSGASTISAFGGAKDEITIRTLRIRQMYGIIHLWEALGPREFHPDNARRKCD